MTMLTVTEAAYQLGVSADSLRRWHARGLLPAGSVIVSPGGHRRVDVASVRGWMERRAELLKQGRNA